MRHGIARMAVAGIAAVAVLALAGPAHAGTVRYTIPESPNYAVEENGNGIVKVNYYTCVTAGVEQTFDFNVVTNVSQDSGAVYSTIGNEGDAPTSRFDVNGDEVYDDPPRVQLTRGQDQTSDIRLAFTIAEPTDRVTEFRIKLDPDSGEGLGQGAGVVIRIPCVLAAPSQQGGSQLTAPTAGTFPAVTAPQSRRSARCLAVTRRIQARAGERSRIVVRVMANETNIRGSLVRITGPGFVTRRRTGTDGIVSFTVRPTRSGRIYIQSDVCFGADTARVLAARSAQGQAAPRFTG